MHRGVYSHQSEGQSPGVLSEYDSDYDKSQMLLGPILEALLSVSMSERRKVFI